MNLRVVAGWVTTAAVGAAMLAWSWGTWPNAYVDFGRELYVPWRLTEGEVLYRDIAWFNGPLSPSWNALLFGVFGTGLRVLVLANLTRGKRGPWTRDAGLRPDAVAQCLRAPGDFLQ